MWRLIVDAMNVNRDRDHRKQLLLHDSDIIGLKDAETENPKIEDPSELSEQWKTNKN